VNVAHTGAFAHGKFARIGLHFACQHGQQGGLAGTIRANEPDAVAIVYGKGNVLEEWRRAKALGDALCIQNRRHRF